MKRARGGKVKRKRADDDFNPEGEGASSDEENGKSTPGAEEEKKSKGKKVKLLGFPELSEFMKSNAGNLDSIKEFTNMINKSSGTRRLTNQLITQAFALAKDNASLIEWAENVVEAVATKLLEPKKRIKDCMFFPSKDSEQKLIHYLDTAKEEMLVCIFTITNNNLAESLRNAHNRGVKVRVISDDENLKMLGSDVQDLRTFGIPVCADKDPRAHMHNKFVVIDSYLLITGSFNWTCQAVNKNQENLLVVEDTDLSRDYKTEFEKLWTDFYVGQWVPTQAPVAVAVADPVQPNTQTPAPEP